MRSRACSIISSTGGTQALVVAGSTGEAHALDAIEYDRLLAFAVKHVGGRVPVLAGTGTANTEKTITATRRALALGADAALVVTPYYVRPTQDGLVRHFSEVADKSGLPIVLYNVPAAPAATCCPKRLPGSPRTSASSESRRRAAKRRAWLRCCH